MRRGRDRLSRSSGNLISLLLRRRASPPAFGSAGNAVELVDGSVCRVKDEIDEEKCRQQNSEVSERTLLLLKYSPLFFPTTCLLPNSSFFGLGF